MNYHKMVKNAPKKSEEVMWGSVEAVSELVEKLKTEHPEIARRFLMAEYSRMYGPHFCEELAREVVSGMWHMKPGSEPVMGEMVTPEDASGVLSEEQRDGQMWDAYVGVNGLMHDLAATGASKGDVMKIARAFWFGDDDWDGDGKVFWYYSCR